MAKKVKQEEEEKEVVETKVDDVTPESVEQEVEEVVETKVDDVTQESAEQEVEEVADTKVDEEAMRIFENYDTCGELFKTTDGYYFLERQDALNHAKLLKDSTILKIKRN